MDEVRFSQLQSLVGVPRPNISACAGTADALAYWQHSVLGPQLKECCEFILQIEGRSTLQIFGSTDAIKLRSSMTLFAESAPDSTIFAAVLQKYCGGHKDAANAGVAAPLAAVFAGQPLLAKRLAAAAHPDDWAFVAR